MRETSNSVRRWLYARRTVASDAVLLELEGALSRAEAEGFQRGYAQARADLFGQDVSRLFADIVAEWMETAAPRLQGHDLTFAEHLRAQAAALRESVDPPAVVASDPADGATSIPADWRVSLVFDRELDLPSVTEHTVQVRPVKGGAALKAAVSYDQDRRTVTLVPEHGLSAGVSYRLVVDGVKSRHGRPMPEPVSFEFTTE